MPELKSSLAGLGNRALGTVPPSAIRAVDNKISTIPGIIKLTLGEPDFAVPEHIKAATEAAIDADWSHYAPSFGYLELRQQISQYLADRFDAHYQADGEVVVTVGLRSPSSPPLTGCLTRATPSSSRHQNSRCTRTLRTFVG